MGTGVADPGPAQAYPSYTGTWRTMNASTFKIPANWKCGKTTGSHDGRYGFGFNSIAQACEVRSGNYVQGALIIRSQRNYNLAARPTVRMGDANRSVDSGVWTCPASSLAPYGLSVCFTATMYKPKTQRVTGAWPNNTTSTVAFGPTGPFG